MNIYIYGNNSFKKEIHETLEHANIKFKLDSDSKIEDITSLELLKSTIESNPNDIYLIDDEKIIKKNALTQKIKFLTPKDGIEEEFLLDNGIADISVDSLKEIPKYILKKYEQQKELDPNIQNSIIDIVDEAYDNDDNDLDIELDDELSELLSDAKHKEINLDEIASPINLEEDEDNVLSKDEFADIINFEEDVGLSNIESDYDQEIKDKLDVNNIENIILEEPKEGDNMSSNFSELDSLNEQDVLSALESIGSSSVTTTNNTSNEKIEVASSNVQDISELISKLLNNKTLEITIKVKD